MGFYTINKDILYSYLDSRPLSLPTLSLLWQKMVKIHGKYGSKLKKPKKPKKKPIKPNKTQKKPKKNVRLGFLEKNPLFGQPWEAWVGWG